jgi:hypothetical protein
LGIVRSVNPGLLGSSRSGEKARKKRGLHVGEVRLAVGVERRRHADEDGVGLPEAREVRRRGESVVAADLPQDRIGKMLDIGTVRFERGDLSGVRIETDHGEAALREAGDEGKAHVTEADDPDDGGLRPDLLFQRGGGHDGRHA